MVNFPASLDALLNPGPSDSLDNITAALKHARQHDDINDAVEALQAKVGVDAETFIYVAPGATAGTRINAAITALPAGGGVIRLGAGTYNLDTGIVLSKSVTLAGAGTATLLSFDGGVVAKAIAMADTTQRQIYIRDLRINTTTGSDNTGTAIDASYFFNSVIQRVTIGSSSNQTPNIGIVFGALGTYYNAVKDCRIQVGGASSAGVDLNSNANFNAVYDTKVLGDTSSSAIRVNTAHSCTFVHVASDTAAMAIGIDLQTAAHDTTILGCYFEGMGIGLKVASGVESVRWYGGYISTSGTADVQDNGAVGLTIDNLWKEFNPYSSLDRTGVAKSKVNGINTPGNLYQPEDRALAAWAWDPAVASSTSAFTNGTLFLVRLNLRYAQTVTSLLIGLGAAATTPTASQNYLGLYNAAGTLVASTAATALDTPSATTGIKSVALSAPYAAAAGEYWVGILMNAATPAQGIRGSGSSLTIANLNSAAAAYRFAVNGTGLTALPASITPASNSLSGAAVHWAAAA